jgi:hypothetical protein
LPCAASGTMDCVVDDVGNAVGNAVGDSVGNSVGANVGLGVIAVASVVIIVCNNKDITATAYTCRV